MKRPKNIEGKNKDQLDTIKDQGEKQLDEIEKQKENNLKMVEKDEIVYLEDKIDELFEMYPNSFDKKSKILVNRLVKNENQKLITKISYTEVYYPMVNFLNLFFSKNMVLYMICWKI